MADNRFNLPEGVRMADLSGIEEGFDENRVNDRYCLIRVNVSAENIAPYFLKLIQILEEPGFFVIELPVSKTEEKALRKKDSDPCHKHVYYLDGITHNKAFRIFNQYQHLFVNDGMVNFGFGSITHEEVFVGAYKIFEIYTPEPEKFLNLFESMSIKRSECLKTVRNNISPDTPGERCTIECEPSIRDMLGEVMKMGFYLADTRED